jgi:leader peptidase (prepilin peptidase) / N-methyltransferase
MSTDPNLNPYAAVPFHFWTATFFVFGAIVGSFLNVVIHRLPREESIVHPPSHCPHCLYRIPWFLNIPIVTWLMIGGRCSNCRAPITARYFLVEMLTGAMFASCWLAFGKVSLGIAIAYSILIAGMLAATFIDFEHFIIPNEINFGGMGAGLLASMIVPALHGTDSWLEGLKWSAVGLVAGAGIVWFVVQFGKLLFGRYHVDLEAGQEMIFTDSDLILPDRAVAYGELFYRKTDFIRFHAERLEMADRCYWDADVEISQTVMRIGSDTYDPEPVTYMSATTETVTLPREAMGFGDVKFMGAIGAFLGWQAVVFSLILSSLIGSFIGVTMIVLGRRDWSSRLPYGPYIALAAFVWIYFGKSIMARLMP